MADGLVRVKVPIVIAVSESISALVTVDSASIFIEKFGIATTTVVRPVKEMVNSEHIGLLISKRGILIKEV